MNPRLIETMEAFDEVVTDDSLPVSEMVIAIGARLEISYDDACFRVGEMFMFEACIRVLSAPSSMN